MAGITAVLFDLDGTLLDTHAAVVTGLRAAIAGLPGAAAAWKQSDIDELLRMRPAEIMQVVVPRHAELATRRYEDFYLAHSAEHVRPFAGTAQLLDGLDSAGIPYGLVTNKGLRRVEADARTTGLDLSRFHVTVTAEDSAERKPSPVPLQIAAARAGWEDRDLVYVGDAPHDVQAALAAGMWAVALTHGYYSRAAIEEWEPDLIVDDPADVLRAILARRDAS